MGNFFHLWPVLLFLAFMLGVSFWGAASFPRRPPAELC